VIWGASGFTGKIVVEHMKARAPKNVKWAIGGRNKGKLEQISKELSLQDVDIVIGNSLDQESMDNIASKAKVVLSCVGPYAKFGTPLVDSCVRKGTHYCDITGETWWVADLIEKYHEKAKKDGVMIVNGCGLDSVPSDLCTLIAVQTIKDTYDSDTFIGKSILMEATGRPSGGTIASLMSGLTVQNLLWLLKNTYALNPPNTQSGKDSDPKLMHYDQHIKSWTIPWVMGNINSRVVRRSAALLGYGKNFHYEESMKTSLGSGIFSMMKMATVPLLFVPGVKWVLSRFLPVPGEGPSKQEMAKGFFKWKHIAIADDDVKDSAQPHKVIIDLDTSTDAGYNCTAIWVSEIAIYMLDLITKHSENISGGVITPAIVLKDDPHALVERLKASDINFRISTS
jgi:short subunit dehydrogenase-like uncharacterized protein